MFNWKTRKLRLLEEVLRHEPDIVAMEELDHFADFFEPALQKSGMALGPLGPCPFSAKDHSNPSRPAQGQGCRVVLSVWPTGREEGGMGGWVREDKKRFVHLKWASLFWLSI